MTVCYAEHAQKKDTTELKTHVIVNDTIIPLNDFTQNYIGNVLKSVVASLGYTSTSVAVHIDNAGLRIYTAEEELPLLKDFARLLIESTVKGLISPLRGVFWFQNISVLTKDVPKEAAIPEQKIRL